jgi:hypothetical protein
MAEQAKRQIEYCERIEREREAMARGRPAKQATTAIALLEALAFVKVATTNDATLGTNAEHVRMSGNMVVAFDGQMSAGHPIAEELNLCPHIGQLTKALSRSGKTLVIAETDGGRLSIKGEKLRALVPCLSADDLPPAGPDPRLAPADDRIKAAFKCCGSLASEAAKRVIEASLLLRRYDCTGTNGAAILQLWHGIDLPPDMVVPKIYAAAVAAVKQPIEGFGASFDENNQVKSLTFFFQGGGWLKSLCYADKWPNIEPLWQQANLTAVPDGFFDAVETVAEFNDVGFITFADNAVWSHCDPNVGAQYDVPGLQAGKGFYGKLIAQVRPWCGQIDLTTYPDRAFFTGGEAETPVRGIIMGTVEETKVEVKPPERKVCPQDNQACTIPDACSVACQRVASSASGWGGTPVDDDVPMPEGDFSADLDDEIPF